MPPPNLEGVRGALFAHPGVKAVAEDPTLFQASGGGVGVRATLTVASPEVDMATVKATLLAVLQAQFAISDLILEFTDPGPAPAEPGVLGPPLEKK